LPQDFLLVLEQIVHVQIAGAFELVLVRLDG